MFELVYEPTFLSAIFMYLYLHTYTYYCVQFAAIIKVITYRFNILCGSHYMNKHKIL